MTAARAVVVSLRPFATGGESSFATSNPTTGSKGGRPRKHADAAARQKAYRERNDGIVTWRLSGVVAKKVSEIAAEVDLPANELAHQMLKFALCNRNWRENPMFGAPLPSAAGRQKKGDTE